MIRAAIFDKDGTLFHFTSSWGAWTQAVLQRLTIDEETSRDLAHILGFDPKSGTFLPSSIVIAHSTPEIAQVIAGHLGRSDVDILASELAELSLTCPMVPAADLPQTFRSLRAAGLRIGLATNDTEDPARHHLSGAGILGQFDFVAGCDSGWGGKPAPGQLLAFAKFCKIDPSEIVMVGDSVHDMVAAKAAGMVGLAVLTGIASEDDLLPHCDAVLADIALLPDWILAQNRPFA